MPSRFHAASLLTALAGMAGTAAPALAQNGGYTSTFDDPAGLQWSEGRLATAPKGERFLGTFGNESVKLALDNLPDHTHVVIALDLYIIGPWGGIGPLDPEGIPQALAHEWSMLLDKGEPVLRATFSNDDTFAGRQQSYPDAIEVRNPARRGAFKINELGYNDPFSLAPRDSIYRLYFTVKHSGPTATFTFAATGLNDDTVQRWGIDNVAIETYDMSPLNMGDIDPTGALHGGGLMGGGGGDTNAGPVGDPLGGPMGGGTPPSKKRGVDGNPPPTPPPSTIPSPGAAVLLLMGGAAAAIRRRRV